MDAFAFDLRWKYAAGALDFDHPGFMHTVLVDMRARLRRSTRPDRFFETVLYRLALWTWDRLALGSGKLVAAPAPARVA